jgi:hypothetical protein
MLSALNPFRAPNFISQVKNVDEGIHFPISVSNLDNIIDFSISGNTEAYINLKAAKFYFKARVLHSDGTEIAATEKVAFVNQWGSSLIKQCDVFLNDTLITTSDNMYAHKAYFHNLLTFNNEAAKNQLSAQGWDKDDSGKFDSLTTADNQVLKRRSDLIKSSKFVECESPLFVDMFMQDLFLIPGVNIKIRLTRAPANFCLMTGEGTAGKEYKIEIAEVILRIPKYYVNTSTRLSHESFLRNNNAIYAFRRSEIRSFSIDRGSRTVLKDNISLTQSPTKILIAMLDTSALTGNYTKNPYNFQHFNVNYVNVIQEGRNLRSRILTPDFSKELYMSSYMSLVELANRDLNIDPMMISYLEYKGGFTMFGFFAQPPVGNEEAMQLITSGNIRMELKFDKDLETNITILVVMDYDSILEITGKREIIYTLAI